MNTTKRILAGIIALVALAALALASSLFIKKPTANKTEYKKQVQAPSNSAPQWTLNGQHVEPDYSSRNKAARTATKPLETAQEKLAESNVPASPPKKAQPTESIEEKAVVIHEDEQVPFAFIESLAGYVLSRFHPQTNNKQPYTKASFQDLNIYFGRTLDGLNATTDNPRTNRTQILNYVFTPQMIKTLYSLYASAFVAELAEQTEAENANQTPPLTNADLAALFQANGAQLAHVGNIFMAIAKKPEITKQTALYIQSLRAVERTNALFQESLVSSVKDRQKNAADRLKNAIQKREHIREGIIQLIQGQYPQGSTNDMFYVALWSYRRTLGGEENLSAFAAAGESLLDLSRRFNQKADDFMVKKQ